MIINTEDIVIEYLNKYGFLFENDSITLLEDIKTNKKIEEVNKKFKKKLDDLIKHRDEALEKIKEFGKDAGETFRDDIIGNIDEELSDKLRRTRRKIQVYFIARKLLLSKQKQIEIQKIIATGKKTSLVISGLGLSSLLIFSSYQMYKKDKIKYQYLCKNKRGKNKKICLANAKIAALKNRYKFLDLAMTRCNHSKDPVKCKANIHKELLEIQTRITDIINNKTSEFTKQNNKYVY